MATTRELRRRIRSVRTTRQITRAMELVASSKLRGAIKVAAVSQRYAEGVSETLARVLSQGEGFQHPLLSVSTSKRSLAIAFSSDQGLAGTFHSNNLKACMALPATTDFYVLGKRLKASLRRLGRTVLEPSQTLSRTLYSDELTAVATDIAKLFESNAYAEAHLVSTLYQSALLQQVTVTKLLPFTVPAISNESLLLEPALPTVLEQLLRQTLRATLVSAARQTRASEFAIRRTSMHAATENAGDLIERYTLAYNRARQAAITTEIAEIVGGASALNR